MDNRNNEAGVPNHVENSTHMTGQACGNERTCSASGVSEELCATISEYPLADDGIESQEGTPRLSTPSTVSGHVSNLTSSGHGNDVNMNTQPCHVSCDSLASAGTALQAAFGFTGLNQLLTLGKRVSTAGSVRPGHFTFM
ncbi:hypothetical protein M758_UG050800 [Ceratodon purpureus]|nr:hypothetical protein M758_UG050800 [Ceratodon purpureus]